MDWPTSCVPARSTSLVGDRTASALRIPPSEEIPSEDTATRPVRARTSAAAAGSSAETVFSRSITLRCGAMRRSVRFEFRIGARDCESTATSITASTSNGFITMRSASCPCSVVPSAANQRVPASGAHGSAATPVADPPACVTHPAATHPPKYSTNDDEAGSVEAAGTLDLGARIDREGRCLAAALGRERRDPDLGRRRAGIRHVQVGLPLGAASVGTEPRAAGRDDVGRPGPRRRLRTIQGDAGRHDGDDREDREAQAPPGPHRDDPGLRVIHRATAQSRASTQTERVRTH